jgi:hypothetical protein
VLHPNELLWTLLLVHAVSGVPNFTSAPAVILINPVVFIITVVLVKGLSILISTFCVCADGFQGLSKAFHCPIQLLTLFASLKILIWKMPQKFLLCDWSMFSSADLSLAAREMCEN